MNSKLFAALMLTAAFLCPQVGQAQIGPVFESGPSDSALFDIVINLPEDQASFMNGEIGSPGSPLTTQVNLQPGGTIDDAFGAVEQVEINVNGGSIGNSFAGIFGVEVNLNSGSIGDNFLALGTVLNISGGSIGDNFTAVISEINVFGSEFLLNGAPLTSLIPDQAFSLNQVIDQINADSILSATLLDGSPLDLAFSSIDAGSTVTVTLVVPEPTSSIPLIAILGGFVARRRRSGS